MVIKALQKGRYCNDVNPGKFQEKLSSSERYKYPSGLPMNLILDRLHLKFSLAIFSRFRFRQTTSIITNGCFLFLLRVS